jgi:hypothetical protein
VASDSQQRASQRSSTTSSGRSQQQPSPQARAQQARVQQARTQQARGQQARAQQVRAAGASTARPGTGRDTDEFARLMRNNTVDVRDQARRAPRRNPIVGKIALGLAVVSAAVDASAFAVFMGGDTDFAFGICFVVVFLTLVAAVLGFVAAVGSFGRWYGAVGVVVAFVANPVILIVLLVVVAPEVLTDMGGSGS